MNPSNAARLWAANAAYYDPERRRLIPCFDAFYGAGLKFAESETLTASILELGCGTGMFSAMLRQRHPAALLTLIDSSPEMLQKAGRRFAGDARVVLRQCDYSSDADRQALEGGQFDLVASALSIHHLEDEAKQSLFAAAYRWLRPGGRFVNVDQARGSGAWFERRFEEDWLEQVRATDLSAAAIAASQERRKLDRNATVEEQLGWLRAAGFRHADLVFRDGFFAVFVALA